MQSKKYQSIPALLAGQIKQALGQLEFDDSLDIEIKPTNHIEFGHYQCNSAMRWAKTLKINPKNLAGQLIKQLKNQIIPENQCSKIELAGPGFINFTFTSEFFAKQLKIISKAKKLGVNINPENKNTKIIIDFSSPNIAKQMHVGHLRTTLIGDAIARLFEFYDYNVLRLNHLGDWGTSFGMLIAYIKLYHSDFEAQASLEDLENWYKQSKKLFDEDEQFKQQARLEVVNLQNGDKQAYRLWEKICEISKKAFKQIYKILEIDITDRGESFYNPWLSETVKDLEKKKLIKISDGAKCVFLDGFELPLIVQKQDGGYNYATTDLAALNHRANIENGKKIIYLTDAGQALHFSMVFQTAKLAGWVTQDFPLIHLPFGMVLRADGKKFKTREGGTVKLIDLIQEAIQEAKNILVEREPNMGSAELEKMAKILGVNAVKYSELSCNRNTDYKFDPKRMVQFEGNTAAFLLYAYVRIQSIIKKVNSTSKVSDLNLSTDIELRLAHHICQFNDILDKYLEDLLPNKLTEYLFNLAELFQSFYHECRVEGAPEQESRLALCNLIAKILKQGFDLLGLKPLDRM